MAGKNPAVEAGRQIKRTRARSAFPGDEICCARIATHHRPGRFEFAGELVDPSTLERRWEMSATQNAVAPGDDWRSNDGLVSEVPEMTD